MKQQTTDRHLASKFEQSKKTTKNNTFRILSSSDSEPSLEIVSFQAFSVMDYLFRVLNLGERMMGDGSREIIS